MKNKKKTIIILSSAAAVVLIVIGCLVLAYLTQKDEVVNVFTVGDVKIALYEDKYPGNADSSVNNMLPYTEINKNPTIENTGTNSVYVFLEIAVPVENITEVSFDGTTSEKKPQEIFYLKTNDKLQTDLENSFNDGWVELRTEESGTEYKAGTVKTYVFAYNKVLSSGQATTALFDKIQLKNIIENEILSDSDLHIDVKALGIQSDHLEEDFPEEGLKEEQLTKIYAYLK